MASKIHNSAIIHPDAQLGNDVEVGPFAIIEGNVKIGDRTRILGHAQILSGADVGEDCRIFSGAIVSGIPQDLKFDGSDSVTTIGNNTIIREFVTLNRGTQDGVNGTVIGSNCLLMAYVHVGHDTEIGDNVIIANSVNTGGFVKIADYAGIGGGTPVHQFTHIGAHAFVAGGYRAVQDVPPYILASGEPLKYTGLNSIGLQRRGFSQEARDLIKRAYRIIYRSKLNVQQATEQIRKELELTPEVQTILDFVENSDRGLI